MSTEEDEKSMDVRAGDAPSPRFYLGKRAMKMVVLKYWLRRTHCRCEGEGMSDSLTSNSGFTIAEILIVVLIIAIAAMMAVPMISSASSMQIQSAANVIAADLEYAKSMAITRQKTYTVVFDKSNERYQIESPDGIIAHPIKKGFPYIVDFRGDSRLGKVDISNVDFGGSPQVGFNLLGSPVPDEGGFIELCPQGGGAPATITVEPVTGYISISY